ncbi:hypothetical protein Fmac_019699 [Flemingia macrophylla]|uniref:Integral membrane bound transporter domain-containing protein n=1 Tax=Flemingia macrophylla TaxID=520843 RepID=A0ABD1M9A6_9FABA
MAASLWRECLSSALRTALACTIVGCVTLYSPSSFCTLIAFPAFSYVTAITIINNNNNNNTLGHAFRACCLALYATILAIGPAMLTFCLVGVRPTIFNKVTTAVAVALAAFLVVLPSPHLIAKRISLGQVVLLYVVAYDKGVGTDPIMHPLSLVASTALGVVACVVALMLPYPRLACYQMNQSYKLLTKNTLKRLKLFIKVISEEDKTTAMSLISHDKSLESKRAKLLSIIMRNQEGMQWEKLPMKIFRSNCLSLCLIERLQAADANLRGMKLALACNNSFPVKTLDEDLKQCLNILEKHVSLTLIHTTQTLGGGSLTIPESNTKNISHFLQSLHTIPTTHQDLPVFFFLFCATLLHKKPLTEPSTCAQSKVHGNNSNSPKGKEKWGNWVATFRSTNVMPAIKFSLSLGLSVFMGLLYSKENGFWAGLPLAVSYVSGREATFRAANVKAHGTVLGTVYGLLGCFVFERFLPISFLSLLPWFIFTSFLQRSPMYGPAGGISAVIGAVLILGRKNFGPPGEFAIARITETFIGLSCSIFVDLIFLPKRASTCAKMELSRCLASLGGSLGGLSLLGKTDLEDNKKRLKMQLNDFRNFVVEAEAEPNFWFLPFNSACYNKLLNSFTRMEDLLWFGEHATKFLQQEFQRSGVCGVNMLEGELGHEIFRTKFVRNIEKENNSYDIETGKASDGNTCMVSGLGEDGIIEQTIGSFLHRSRLLVDKLYGDEGDNELKSQVVLSLSALGFCLYACLRETIQIEEAIKELVQWENPTSEVN